MVDSMNYPFDCIVFHHLIPLIYLSFCYLNESIRLMLSTLFCIAVKSMPKAFSLVSNFDYFMFKGGSCEILFM